MSCLFACLSVYQWRLVGPLVRVQLYDTLGWLHKLETMVLLYSIISSDIIILDRVQYQDLYRSHFTVKIRDVASTTDWKSCLLHLNENKTLDIEIIFLLFSLTLYVKPLFSRTFWHFNQDRHSVSSKRMKPTFAIYGPTC